MPPKNKNHQIIFGETTTYLMNLHIIKTFWPKMHTYQTCIWIFSFKKGGGKKAFIERKEKGSTHSTCGDPLLYKPLPPLFFLKISINYFKCSCYRTSFFIAYSRQWALVQEGTSFSHKCKVEGRVVVPDPPGARVTFMKVEILPIQSNGGIQQNFKEEDIQYLFN